MSLIDSIIKLAGIRCPRCAYQIKLADMKAAKSSGRFVCPQCQHVINDGATNASSTISIDKTNYRPSNRVKVLHQGPEFKIKTRWLSRSSLPIIVFAILWNSFIAFFVTMIFFQEDESQIDFLPITVIGLFALIGVGMLIFSLRELLNSSHILLRFGELTYWDSPLSLAAKKKLNISEVKEITLKRAEGGRMNGQKIFNHFVFAYLKNGDQIRLARLKDMNDAIYVEKLLEEKLSLKDDPSLDKIEE